MALKIATTFFVFILFWAIAAFLVLPFGIRTHHDDASENNRNPDLIPGQAESAPSNFQPKRFVLRTTLVAMIAYALFYANYVEGWVTLDDVSLVHGALLRCVSIDCTGRRLAGNPERTRIG